MPLVGLCAWAAKALDCNLSHVTATIINIMHPLAAVAQDDSSRMQDNLNGILHSLFAVFENLSEMGATWGNPWEWLFPLFVALFVALAFAGGFRFVFDLSADKIKGLFIIALVVVGLLALRGITDAGEDAVATEQSSTDGG